MPTEDEIRTKLLQGAAPEQLIIGEGYKKSTVYKVRKSLLSEKVPAPQNAFFIENIKFNGMNYELYRSEPNGRVIITGIVRNVGLTDLYVTNVGVMPEWLEKENFWYSSDESFLLKPNQTRNLAFSVEIGGVDYGEYTVKFGIKGQWLSKGPQISGQSVPSVNIFQTMWTDPIVMNLKKPLTNYSVFISHSVSDVRMVRYIANFLDLYGIRPIIAEDISQPGSYLQQKFTELIDGSSVFLVILTDSGIRSEWVRKECLHAIQTGKVIIPLKEHDVLLKDSWFPIDIEWIEFSMNDAAHILVQKISDGINSAINRARQVVGSPFIGGLLTGGIIVALLALIFGRK